MKEKFKNPHIEKTKRSPYHFLRFILGGYKGDKLHEVPESFSYPLPSIELDHSMPTVEWINHCSFHIEVEGVTILTDPIWGKRCSPVPFIGPKRKHAPSKSISDLKKVDIVLISHNHYDHLDAPTVRELHKRFPLIRWVVPKGLSKWFIKRGINRVYELDWWQEISLQEKSGGPELVICGVPAQHHSGRHLFDGDKTLWSGFVVTCYNGNGGRKRFYFVGDTGYNDHDFKKIGKKFEEIDLCLCPIGTYQPSEFMLTVHSSPADAVAIHKDVGAALSLGMHWKTFKLSTEGLERPPFDLYMEMTKHNLNPHHFLPLEPGVRINW